MSYHQACSAAMKTHHLTPLDLEHRRHFVGLWTRNARVVAGSDDDSIYDLHPSRSKPLSYYTLTWSGLSIGGGKFLTVSTTFAIGKKDLSPVLASHEGRVYESHIQAAGNMTVLFYSSLDRRGWLVDGATALVHLARAWLTSQVAKHKSPDAIHRLHYIEDNGGRESAIDILRANKEIKIFEDTDTTETYETSISAGSVSEQEESSMDSGYTSQLGRISSEPKRLYKRSTSQWTYKALIIDLWRNLESMKAKLDLLKSNGNEVRLRLPSQNPLLTGWDVVDFLLGKTPLEPRFVELKPESESWNRFAKEISSVPLMAESFHDLVLPRHGSQVCKAMETLPVHRDLLAAPLSALLSNAHRFLRWEGNLAHYCARLTDHTILVNNKRPGELCPCSQGCQCIAISVLKRNARRDAYNARSIFVTDPDAAVIIGASSSLWKRMFQSVSKSTQSVGTESRQHVTSSAGLDSGAMSDSYLESEDNQHKLVDEEGSLSSDEGVYLSCEEA